MKINWKVRLRQKEFIITLIATIILNVQAISTALGYNWELTVEWYTVINSVLGLLVFLGVIIDPTTDKLGDSKQAQGYIKPKKGDE